VQGWLPVSLSNARQLKKMLALFSIDIRGVEQVGPLLQLLQNTSL
jgi:hypothetical protein